MGPVINPYFVRSLTPVAVLEVLELIMCCHDVAVAGKPRPVYVSAPLFIPELVVINAQLLLIEWASVSNQALHRLPDRVTQHAIIGRIICNQVDSVALFSMLLDASVTVLPTSTSSIVRGGIER